MVRHPLLSTYAEQTAAGRAQPTSEGGRQRTCWQSHGWVVTGDMRKHQVAFREYQRLSCMVHETGLGSWTPFISADHHLG